MSTPGRKLVTSPPGSMKQDRLFYNTEWSTEIEDRFIRALLNQHFKGNTVLDGPNQKAISFACMTVNKEFGTTFDYGYCVNRYRKLRKRYKVFKWMIDMPGIKYDAFNNVVRAEIGTWERLFRVSQKTYIVKNMLN